MTRKDQILFYLSSSLHPICDDCLAEITYCSTRQEANQICRKLSERNLISRNKGYCNRCKRNKIINQIRSVNPIINQNPLQKKDSPDPSFLSINESEYIFSNIVYSWHPIQADTNSIYQFPNSMTPYMKFLYKLPTIYRWVIQFPDKKYLYYIGETEKLCPNRLGSYLNPGPSQETNKRLHILFLDYLRKGCHIRLDYLKFAPFTLNSYQISQESLKNANLRRMIEHLIIYHYENQGVSLLNR